MQKHLPHKLGTSRPVAVSSLHPIMPGIWGIFMSLSAYVMTHKALLASCSCSLALSVFFALLHSACFRDDPTPTYKRANLQGIVVWDEIPGLCQAVKSHASGYRRANSGTGIHLADLVMQMQHGAKHWSACFNPFWPNQVQKKSCTRKMFLLWPVEEWKS